MIHVRRSTVVFALIIASLSVLIFWYYQKSTSVEDGALDLLDRFAQARARISELESQIAHRTE